MSGHNKNGYNEPFETGSNSFDYIERLHELQVVNDILTKTYQLEDTDIICELTGEAVHKLNRDCYVIVSLYDGSTNAVRIRAAIGLEGLTEKAAGIPEKGLDDISFRMKDMELNSHLFTSGKLESFKDGLHALLAKKVPSDSCKKVEEILNIDSIRVIGFSNEEKVFGSISILVPKGQKVKNVSAIETIASHISTKIQAIYTKKDLLEAENRFKLLFQQAPLSYHSLDEYGYFIDVNNTWLENLGYSYEEVVGKWLGDFLAPEYVEIFKQNFLKFGAQGETHGSEYEVIRKDGKRINIVIDGKIAYNEDGSFKQTHCVFKDITAQKKAERKAFENEKLLRSMMDAITESAILVEPDSTVVYINETAARRLKTTPEECIGRKLNRLLPEEIKNSRKQMFDSALAERRPVKFKDMRGGHYCLNNIYPVYDSSNQLSYFAIFSMNITEYKESKNKLKWELAVNRSLAELADALIDPNNSIETIANIVLSVSQELTGSEHGYVSSIDPETGDNVCHTLTRMMENCSIKENAKRIAFPKRPDGLYPKLLGHSLNTKKGFYTNSPEMYPGSGGAPEGHISLNNFLSVPAIVGDELMGQISLANSKRGYSDSEFEAIRKVAALYALALQQKRASMELQYRDTILKSIFESTVDGIFVVDKNHKILFSNSKLVKMLKIPEALASTKNYEKLFAFFLGQVKCPEEYVLKEQTIYSSNETDNSYIHFKDGRTFESLSTPLISNGITKGRVWSIRDVTEKAEAEKALVNAKIHAEEANRTKSEFLTTMSHELRTPLNSVIGYSNILLTQMFGPLNERQLKYLNNISISGNHLLNLINDILDISRIESGDVSLSFETVSVADVFEDVKNIAVPLATSKKISMDFSAEPLNLEIYADKIKFKQILHNLVNNALKFTPENGYVQVETKKSRNIIEISVRDSGIGIPEDKQKTIFEPFKQVDSSLSRMYNGTGLGLTIVKKFVEMHGGEIRVKSEVEKGSTFTIIMPCRREII
ncbi:PAS domain S-box protein [Methanosarcina sp. KYL-1]|uniref:PAS domain S-box protein n=1 Tax=Methanosarcina sp. KYL-1 TaxID=2602068 RepID=UPI0021014740|nr:PAS domain S-box protein [Methanosarcina sp. KYL-1]MCQ1534943.1 PAS domain S-box protein [Methanosarcina sp. KYL-1]